MVRSVLEYCAVIWNHFNLKHINELELVQNRLLRYTYYKRYNAPCPIGYSVHALKETFLLKSLEIRRSIFSIVFIYKLFNNKIDFPSLLQQINFYVPCNRFRANLLFQTPRMRTVHGSNSFLPRSLRLLNVLNDKVDLFGDRYSSFLEKAYVELARLINVP